MKNNKIYRWAFCCLLLLSNFALVGCQKDDNNESYSISGEWFYDNSSANITQLGTMEFAPNGKYEETYAQVGLNVNNITTKVGSYSYNGVIEVVYTTKYDSRQILERYRVTNADENTLELFEETTSTTKKLHRIVGSHTLSVGESIIFSGANSSQYAKYVSCNDKVASVDDNGNIKAVKRGITFIRRLSDSGETIISVEVKDPGNVVDDFSQYICEPLSNVYENWGDNYIFYERDMSNLPDVIEYNVFDNLIQRIDFYYYYRRNVSNVFGYFRPDVDINTIIETFDNKYTRISASADGSMIRYSHTANGHPVDITLYTEKKHFAYDMVYDGFEEYDALVMLNINTLPFYLPYFDFTDCDGQLTSEINNNSIYKEINITYNPTTGDIDEILLKCKPGITEEYVREWFSSHYYIDKRHPGWKASPTFQTNEKFQRSEYIINTNQIDWGETVIVRYKNKLNVL